MKRRDRDNLYHGLRNTRIVRKLSRPAACAKNGGQMIKTIPTADTAKPMLSTEIRL